MDITPEQLRWLREQRRLTREELAKELDCSAGAIVQWEGGKRAIPSWVADKMFAKMPVEFTVQELAEMYDLCREESLTMSELIQDGVRHLLEQRRAAQTSAATNITRISTLPASTPESKVTDDASDYKTGTED